MEDVYIRFVIICDKYRGVDIGIVFTWVFEKEDKFEKKTWYVVIHMLFAPVCEIIVGVADSCYLWGGSHF